MSAINLHGMFNETLRTHEWKHAYNYEHKNTHKVYKQRETRVAVEFGADMHAVAAIILLYLLILIFIKKKIV